MKIGIDARMYGAETATGIGVYLKELIEQLALQDDKNEYVIFLLPQAYKNFSLPNSRFSKAVLDVPWYSWSEQWRLPFVLLRYQLDVMHFPNFNVPIAYPKKFVTTVHDITPKFFPGPRVRRSVIRRLGYWLTFRIGLSRSAKIITVSNHTKNNLINYFHIRPDKINVIYLGYGSQFTPVPVAGEHQTLSDKFHISKPYIVYVGVWRDHKNIVGLVASFAQLKARWHDDVQLVICGDDDGAYPEISDSIIKSAYRADIITPGFVSDHDLPALYRSAKLAVIPSFSEGFGLVALEALACGTAVAASNGTSVAEIAGAAAYYFNPHNVTEMADALHQVLTDETLRAQIFAAAKNQLPRYTWRQCTRQTMAIYQSA